MTTMPNWLKQRAFLTPERIAVSDGRRTKTFAELYEAAAVWARRLAQAGVKEGDIVALLMKNRIEMIEIIHALFFSAPASCCKTCALRPMSLAGSLMTAARGLPSPMRS